MGLPQQATVTSTRGSSGKQTPPWRRSPFGKHLLAMASLRESTRQGGHPGWVRCSKTVSAHDSIYDTGQSLGPFCASLRDPQALLPNPQPRPLPDLQLQVHSNLAAFAWRCQVLIGETPPHRGWRAPPKQPRPPAPRWSAAAPQSPEPAPGSGRLAGPGLQEEGIRPPAVPPPHPLASRAPRRGRLASRGRPAEPDRRRSAAGSRHLSLPARRTRGAVSGGSLGAGAGEDQARFPGKPSLAEASDPRLERHGCEAAASPLPVLGLARSVSGSQAFPEASGGERAAGGAVCRPPVPGARPQLGCRTGTVSAPHL